MGYNIGSESCFSENITRCDTFLIANGSILTVISALGLVLSSVTIYCLLCHVQLPLCQNIFILNVSFCDVLTATLGIIRGTGMISPEVIGVSSTGDIMPWCYIYTIIGNTIWSSSILVLLPLTLDRFIAIAFPFRYKSIITKISSRILSVSVWLPLLALLLYDIITFKNGAMKMSYQAAFHRCTIDNDRELQPVILLLLPFMAIVIMYIIMMYFVIKTGLQSKKLFLLTSAIIITGFVTVIPDHLLTTLKVRLQYEVAQVITVTIYYTNTICNPLIYFCSHRSTRNELRSVVKGSDRCGDRSDRDGVTNTLV